MTIRVGVADDQAIIRSGLRVQVSLAPDLEFVGRGIQRRAGDRPGPAATAGRAADGRADAGASTASTPPPASSLTRRPQAVRVIVLTTFDLDDYVYRALRAGASGFLLKDTTPEQLLDAIRVVADGGALIAPAVTRRLIAEFAARPGTGTANRQVADLLTAREIEVLGLVGRGLDQRRDRRAAGGQPPDREDPRQPNPDQAWAARPQPARHRGLRVRPGGARVRPVLSSIATPRRSTPK